MDFGPGTILAGKYRYEGDLGAGGMGRVVVATHLVLRQRVAVKVLTRTRSPDAARRFLREARLAFRITSPHVPKVLDAGQLDDGVPYIAMELLEGVDLAKLAKTRGAFPVAEACDYVLQACAGIGEAHALGIVHRDVKLANLFVVSTPRGPLVKVLDFGCAKAERTGESSVAHATEDGAWLGTPGCMAPEQLVSARDVDARADVWALGVVLYTLLAGRPPFDGKTLRILYEQIQTQSPPPIEQPLPQGLAAVVERCLRKEPADRFADARHLAAALAPFAKSRAARRRRSLAMALIPLASIALGVSIALVAWHRDPDPTPAPVASATKTASVAAAIPPEPSPSSPPIASTHPHAPVVTPITIDTTTPEQRRVADTVARGFCATQRIRECYTVSDDACLATVRKLYLECLPSNDRPTCMAEKFEQRFPRIQSKKCADLTAPAE